MATVVHYPWRIGLPEQFYGALPHPVEGHIAPGLGAFVVTDGSVKELPGPTIREGAGQLRCREDGADYQFDRNRVWQFQAERNESFPRRLHFALTDSFIHLANRFYVDNRTKKGKPLADWPLSDACTDFMRYLSDAQDFAPESLIVEIAGSCVAPIAGIMANPRLVLYRRHAEVQMDRLQELDEYSLRALAHRPGKRIAEKAGGKQRLTGVVRLETADTYENRVVLDFIRRTLRVADQYCREMCGRCPRSSECVTHDPRRERNACLSKRVCKVADYMARCRAWLMTDVANEVSVLSQPVQRANYVLQQNPRYVTVWRMYLRLLRQENVEEDVWRWERRTWTDYLRLVLMIAWDKFCKNESAVLLSKRPLKITERNRDGRWFCRDPFEEALVIPFDGRYQTVYLLDGAETDALTGQSLHARLNADIYRVGVTEDGHKTVLPIWGIVGCPKFDEEKCEISAEAVMRAEIHALADEVNFALEDETDKVTVLGGVIARPTVDGCEFEEDDGCYSWKFAPSNPDLESAVKIILQKEAV